MNLQIKAEISPDDTLHWDENASELAIRSSWDYMG